MVDLSGDSAPNGKDPAKNPARRKAPRTAAASAAANGSRDRGGARNVSRRRDDVPEEELGQDSGTHNADEDDVAQGEQTNGVRGLNDEENATVGARDTGARSVAGAGEDSEGLEGLRTGSDADQETGYRGAAEAEGSGGIGDLKGKAGEERIAEGDENLEGLEFAEEDLKTGASVLAKIMGKFTGQAAKMLVQEL